MPSPLNLASRGAATMASSLHLGDRVFENWHFLVISIVIDSDRGHCYEHLKKKQFTMKIERMSCI